MQRTTKLQLKLDINGAVFSTNFNFTSFSEEGDEYEVLIRKAFDTLIEKSKIDGGLKKSFFSGEDKDATYCGAV